MHTMFIQLRVGRTRNVRRTSDLNRTSANVSLASDIMRGRASLQFMLKLLMNYRRGSSLMEGAELLYSSDEGHLTIFMKLNQGSTAPTSSNKNMFSCNLMDCLCNCWICL